MTKNARRSVLGWAALLLSACSSDFGAFHFIAADGGATAATARHDAATSPVARRDAGSSAHDAGAGLDASNGTTETGAAGTSASHGAAGRGGHAGSGTGGTAGDAGQEVQDAAVIDASDSATDSSLPMSQDAGICDMQWASANLSTASACGTCACGNCASVVSACLGNSSPAAQAKCEAVFQCALAHDCKDWSCYCATTSCGAPGASGDGPCVTEMEAAAGGKRNEVMAIRQTGDPTKPLVQAMNAIGCVLGLDPKSPGGPLVGHCDAVCP